MYRIMCVQCAVCVFLHVGFDFDFMRKWLSFMQLDFFSDTKCAFSVQYALYLAVFVAIRDSRCRFSGVLYADMTIIFGTWAVGVSAAPWAAEVFF